MLTSPFFINCMKSSYNKQTDKQTKKASLSVKKQLGKKKEMLSCVIFAVASVVAFCNRVNVNVLISWNIVRAEHVRKEQLKKNN